MRFTLTVVLLWAGGCDRDNGAYCDGQVPCATGVCDTTANHCVGSQSPDLAAPDLTSDVDLADSDLTPVCAQCGATTPFCTSGTCVGCDTLADGEGSCAALSATAPHCLTTGAMQGACVGCRSASDCPVPSARICDGASHACRGCTSDGECTSLVCDLTAGSATRGQCVDTTNVIYVNAANVSCDDNKGDSAAMPTCSITKAAMRANKTVVRIANTLYTENVVINNVGPITLVGETGATMRPKDMNMPALLVMGTSVVTLRNLIFTGGLGTGAGILCQNATVVLDRCLVKTNEGYGIDGNTCALVKIDASMLTGNMLGGVRVGGNFDLTNNMIVKNGGAAGGSAGGVSVNSPTTTVTKNFANNTVADNSGSGINAGVVCGVGSSATLLNSILYKNLFGATASETNCTTLYSATDDAVDAARANAHNVDLSIGSPAFVSTTDYHIASSSPCKDVGSTSGAPDHDYDEERRPDSTSNKVDIGADEYYP